jgi:hypothetical protein
MLELAAASLELRKLIQTIQEITFLACVPEVLASNLCRVND